MSKMLNALKRLQHQTEQPDGEIAPSEAPVVPTAQLANEIESAIKRQQIKEQTTTSNSFVHTEVASPSSSAIVYPEPEQEAHEVVEKDKVVSPEPIEKTIDLETTLDKIEAQLNEEDTLIDINEASLVSEESIVEQPQQPELTEKIVELETQLQEKSLESYSKDELLTQLQLKLKLQDENLKAAEAQIASQKENKSSSLEVKTLKETLHSLQTVTERLYEEIQDKDQKLATAEKKIEIIQSKAEQSTQKSIDKICELESKLEETISLQDDLEEEVEANQPLAPPPKNRATVFETTILADLLDEGLNKHYSTLTTNILRTCSSNQHKSILLADIDSPEASAHLAMSISITLAKSTPNILLIDAATEMCPLTKSLECCNQSGLRETLVKQEPWKAHLTELSSGPIHFLSSGNYTFSLSANHRLPLEKIIKEAVQEYNLVIVAADRLELANTSMVASTVDAVYLSAEMGTTSMESIQQSVGSLQNSGANIQGTIATNVPRWCYT